MKRKIASESESLVSRTARALTALSLAARSGEHLGAEEDLLTRLGVSRPTLRQAAKIVQNDHLLDVRRGVKGGFFAARPTAADVIDAPARYLRLNGATIADVHAVAKLIIEAAVAAAAVCDDKALRRRIEGFLERIDDNDSPGGIVRAETELARLVAEMSGNPVARLFIEIGYTFGQGEHQMRFYDNPDDRRHARALQRGLCEAILAHDIDIARLMMQRRSAMIAEWLEREDRAL